MKITFIIGHPAHVHIFKNLILELELKDHKTTVLSRERGIIPDLLDEYEIEHTKISTKGDGKIAAIREVFEREFKTFLHASRERPDYIIGQFSPFAAHSSILPGTDSIILEINEKPNYLSLFVTPFADLICSPSSFNQDRGDKHMKYDGYHELAYLHPNWFTPDKISLQEAGKQTDERYFVLRFVSWDAFHDVGHQGLTKQGKKRLVQSLEKHGEVYISSEQKLPNDMKEYQLSISPDLMHDLLYFSNLYVGDSGTMPIEAGILGTPALCINELTEKYGIFKELKENYDIVRTYSDIEHLLEDAVEIGTSENKQKQWVKKRDRIIEDKIDLTKMILSIITE
jgi:predicted glycosyltransferase